MSAATCICGFVGNTWNIRAHRAACPKWIEWVQKGVEKRIAEGTGTLHLMLHGKWFDMTLHGDKRVEYRQITPNWTKRIWEKRDTLKILVLHRGYTANVIRATITKIDIGPCPYPGWDGDYYRVHFAQAGDIGQ